MDDKIKKIAKLWKRGIITTNEAWRCDKFTVFIE